MRVLLTDNNLANCLVARSILEREGHSIRVAMNGKDTLKFARASRFDAILLDIVMPSLTGLETLKALRGDTSIMTDDNRPFLFALTAYDGSEDMDSYLAAGFDGLIAKPLRPGDLQRAIDIIVCDGTPALNLRQWGHEAAMKRPLLDLTIIDSGPGMADIQTRRQILRGYRTGLSYALKEISATLPGCIQDQREDWVRFRKALHALRSASLTVGLDRAPHMAGKIRDLPAAQLIDGVTDLLHAVRDSLPALDAALIDSTFGSVTARKPAVIVQMRRQHQSKTAHHDKHHSSPIGHEWQGNTDDR